MELKFHEMGNVGHVVAPQFFYCGVLQRSKVCLFDLILNVPSIIFQFYRDESSWVEPVLS